MQLFSLKELRNIEEKNDARWIFHGTSSYFSNQIEKYGWPIGWHPYKWGDIEFLLNLSEKLKIVHLSSVYLEVNYQTQRRSTTKGPFFTYLLDGAVQYAQYTGGETIRCALERAKFLIDLIRDKKVLVHYDDEVRLLSLIKQWERIITTSLPVIYVIIGTEHTFPQLIPKQIKAFEWQIRNHGEVIAKEGDFRSCADIPTKDIIGKAILETKKYKP